ncbi:MAG TPA: hypothetical protein VK186_12185 [Candidatus Deferrimicrobium sp.]|nr:hypothetical protein [Candidatus Deferrimicrobium sp.]
MREYIKLPKTEPLSDIRSKLRELSDDVWKNHIFSHLLRFYKEADFKEIITAIQAEKSKKRSNIEDVIKKKIKKWLKNDQRFDMHDFIINREPSADGNVDGFYDLKFEHSQWKHKYFAFECKNLDRTETSIKEYVYNKTSDDGGVYRYFTCKYAAELDFGGMIGFILEGNESDIISKIIAKLHKTFDDNEIGKLAEKGIIENSIAGNPNTFDSIHLRRQQDNRKNQKFKLHHIVFEMCPK